jgi:type I restriction enzyme S subunit
MKKCTFAVFTGVQAEIITVAAAYLYVIWCVTRFRHSVRLRFYVRTNPTKSEVRTLPEHTEVSFVPMEAIHEYGGLSLDSIRPLTDVIGGYTYFCEGDVLVAKITPCFENGKGAIAEGLTNGIGFGTTELHVLRPHTELNRHFLFYVTISHAFRHLGAAEMYGAGGQKRIPEDFIKDFRLEIPPLEEQQTIAAFLDRETTRIDTLIAKKQQQLTLLQEKRTALISHAVTKGLDPTVSMKDSGVEWLGEIPEHWNALRLATIANKITNGYVGPTRDILVTEGVRYLQSLHIKNNTIRFDGKYFVSEEWSEKHAKSILSKGDVLVVQTGDIGQVAVVPKEYEGCNCHALIILSFKSTYALGEYISLVLNSDYGYHSLKQIQTGALHPHLNCTLVREISVPVPPLDEQSAIISHIKRQGNEIDTLAAKITHSITLLQEHRTALISAAVTGKIDVRQEV